MGRFSGTNLGFTMLAFTAGCGGATPATTGGGGATASATVGVGGDAQATSASVTAGVSGAGGAATATASATASVTAGASGAGGGGEFLCNPAAAPGSIHEATADRFGSAGPESMCRYRGEVMLIVNTAAI